MASPVSAQDAYRYVVCCGWVGVGMGVGVWVGVGVGMAVGVCVGVWVGVGVKEVMGWTKKRMEEGVK